MLSTNHLHSIAILATFGAGLAGASACDRTTSDTADTGNSTGAADTADDAGTSNGTDSNTSDGDDSTGAADSSGDMEDPSPTPAYLIHSAVQPPDQDRSNYFTVVDALSQPTRIDYANSLELPGRARLYADPELGFFAIGDGETTTITRYELGAEGTLVPRGRLSLQRYGVSGLGAQAVLFVSSTKAYYKDDSQAQIIVWNPTDMTIDDVIELPATLLRPGRATSMSAWAARGDDAYIAVGWSSEQYDRIDPGLTLVRIDTRSDALTITEEPRCRGVYKTARYQDTLYFFSGVINGLGYAVYGDEGGQQDCILRILPGASTFDADWVGSVAPALRANEVGTGIAITEDGRAWFQVVDTTMVPTEPGTTYGEWYATGWTWQHVDLATLSNPVKIAGDPGAYAGIAFVIGTSFYISQTKPDYSESTLIDLSKPTPTPGVSFPGFTLDVTVLAKPR